MIDFGSRDETGRLAASFPGVLVHRQEDADRAVAQYAGLAKVSSDFVVFLDADDRLTPLAIQAGLKCLNTNADAWLALGPIESSMMPDVPRPRRGVNGSFRSSPLRSYAQASA